MLNIYYSIIVIDQSQSIAIKKLIIALAAVIGDRLRLGGEPAP